jgi:hypothetical protein
MALVPKNGNDVIYTPDKLAQKIVNHFKSQIYGSILEPCAGGGAFVRALKKAGFKNITELELERGQDFFKHNAKHDWIITNPPWSKARDFWTHSYQCADNVIFLITVNHLIALKRRLKDMKDAGFSIKEMYMVDTPPAPWPQSGFQLGAVHVQRGWKGKTTITWG